MKRSLLIILFLLITLPLLQGCLKPEQPDVVHVKQNLNPDSPSNDDIPLEDPRPEQDPTPIPEPEPPENEQIDKEFAALNALEQSGKFFEARKFVRSMQRRHSGHPRSREFDKAMARIRELMNEADEVAVAMEGLRSDKISEVRTSQRMLRRGGDATRILLREMVRNATDHSVWPAVELLAGMNDPKAAAIFSDKLKQYPEGPLNKLLFDALSKITTIDPEVLTQSYQLLATYLDHVAAAEAAAAEKVAADLDVEATTKVLEKAKVALESAQKKYDSAVSSAKPYEENWRKAKATREAAEKKLVEAKKTAGASANELLVKKAAAEKAYAKYQLAIARASKAATNKTKTRNDANKAASSANSTKTTLDQYRAASATQMKTAVTTANSDPKGGSAKTHRTRTEASLKPVADALAKHEDALVAKALTAKRADEWDKISTDAEAAKAQAKKANTEAAAAATKANTQATSDYSALTSARAALISAFKSENSYRSQFNSYFVRRNVARESLERVTAETQVKQDTSDKAVTRAKAADAAKQLADTALAGDKMPVVMGAAKHLAYAVAEAAGNEPAKFNQLLGDKNAYARLSEFLERMWRSSDEVRLAWARKHYGLIGYFQRGLHGQYFVKNPPAIASTKTADEKATAAAKAAVEAEKAAKTASGTAATALYTAKTARDTAENANKNAMGEARKRDAAYAQAVAIEAVASEVLEREKARLANRQAMQKDAQAAQAAVAKEGEATIKKADADLQSAVKLLADANTAYLAKSVAVAHAVLNGQIEVALANAEKKAADELKKVGETEKKAAQAEKKTADTRKTTANKEKKPANELKKTAVAEKKEAESQKTAAEAEKKAWEERLKVASAKKGAEDNASIEGHQRIRAESKVTAATKKVADATAKIAAAVKKIADADAKFAAAEKKVADATKKVTDAAKKVAAADMKIADAVKKASAAEKKAADAEKRGAAAEKKAAVAKQKAAKEVKTAAAAKANAAIQLAKTHRKVTDKKAEATALVTKLNSEIANSQKSIRNFTSVHTSAKNSLASAETSKKNAATTAEAAAKKFADAKADFQTKTELAQKAAAAAQVALERKTVSEKRAADAKKLAAASTTHCSELVHQQHVRILKLLDQKFPHPDPKEKHEYVGFLWSGVVDIPVEGEYVFYCHASDYSEFKIDGKYMYTPVHHSYHATRKLKPGLHDISVFFHDAAAGYSLTLSWTGPGMTSRVLDDKFLYTRRWDLEEVTDKQAKK